MARGTQWLLLLACLDFSTAWMNERPVLESREGNLFISAAKDRNITLKVLGDGYVNVNDINLLHVANAADSATRLIERWKTGYLAEVETNLQRLMQIVEGPEGLERRVAMMKGFGEGNNTFQPEIVPKNQSTTGVNMKIRMIVHRVRQVEDKVKSIELKLKINECSSNPCYNGGSCQDLYEGYQCHCPSNWEGPNCVVDVNECVRLLGTDLGCQNGATCINLPGSYRCDCAPGWFGLHCTKKTSICNTQNSDELCGHGVCVSKPGSPLGYTCICDQGWQADGTNPACIKDVDECAGNHRPCSVNPWVACRNAPGTFFCDSCPRGYTGNGYYCADIDECQQDNGGCSTSPRVQCINTMGSRMCGSCPVGYRGDGVTCTYVGSCAINNGGCFPFATCVENPGLTSAYVICRCPPGMTGDGIGPNGCQLSTEVSNNTPCASNPCVHGRCSPGYTANKYICLCNPGYTGTTCNVAIDPCSPNPCKNNGVCLISNGAATCDCPSPYTGSRCETARQTCGGVSRNPVGHLEFPLGGNVYQHGLSCAWVLITNSSLVLNVTFTKFNLEQSTDCKYDFLQIHDGRNAGSQMIGRFCGTTFPHGNGNIVSSHNTLYFWFHSDSSISHDGFAFHWNSTKPVCGGSLTGDYGTISSPGSPGRYPPNRDCYWQITVRSSKRIQIHFGQLMLEEHLNCGADFLEISTVHNERLGIYCNHTHPPPLVVPSSQAIIYFHSDSAGQDAGFQIHYSAIEGIPGCNGVYTNPSGTISNPTNLDSYEDLECEWKIQMPVGERAEITWPHFALTNGDCKQESIEIYDGDSNESRLLERYCGPSTPPTIRSNSNIMLIVFKSKLSTKGEFTLSYNILCGGVFTEETGIIQSPGYPHSFDYTKLCAYEIKQPKGKRIVLQLLDADIPGVSTIGCFPSYLRVYSGPDETFPLIDTICNSDAATLDSERVYYSVHNVMFLKFSSMVGNKGRGFKANYTTILSRCGGLYTETTGTIQTPSQGGYYTEDEYCVWTLQAPTGYVVQLSFMSFSLEANVYCRHDYVKIYETEIADKDVIGTFCGSKLPPILMTQGNTMNVVFHSDTSINREGFIATYIFIDATKACGGHFIKKNGVIRSPNYPEYYPGRKECVWIIEAANRHKVILNVKKFELENHPTCRHDYVEIRNGGYETSPLIGKFCGTVIPTEIISQTNQLYLKFVSDPTVSHAGFDMEWDSTTSGCGGSLNAANGDIISPNYPQPYTQQADCYWTIAVAEGSWVRLVIVDLQLEEHDKCRFDYIEISEGVDRRNNQRYCSNPYPKVIQTKSNIVNIRFRSDFSNAGRGFHLTYETVCQKRIQGFYGVIESPNFPNNYDHNLNCSWIIDAPVGNTISLTFSHFDVEGTGKQDVCPYDYLEVREGEQDIPGNQLALLCNTGVLPPRIHSTKHQVFVKFVTDHMLAFGGFRLEWLVEGCSEHLRRPFDVFTSPGYPSAYPKNVDCEWLIEADYAHSIELTIHDINTEIEKGCFFDKLEIYNGENDEAPLLVQICYSNKPVVYTSFGNKLFVRFHSDVSYAARGFNASYRSIPITCGGRYTTDTGVIFSTNYPQNYPNKQNCEWLLQVDQNYVVNITFLDFDIEDTKNCTDDYVQIYDGPTKMSPLLATHCRNELPPSYVSTGNEMLVVMRTDSILSAKGFKAEYSKACGAHIIVKDIGYVTPVESYTGKVNDNPNCTWILIAEDPADHVTISFTHMEIDVEKMLFDVNCSWNYIEVFDGQSLDGPSRGKWCDNVVPLPITSYGNALTVHLYSNYDFLGHFALTYSVLNSACGGTYTSYQGQIASPGYPNIYPLNAECIWIVKNSPGNNLTLTFSQFELQKSDNCDLDYLEIRENNGIGRLLNIFCGTDAETVKTGSTLWIKFKSDGDDVGKGFVAEFKVTGGSELSGPTGRITSPLYPLPFKNGETIGWRVTVEFGWIIRFEITDMFIENSNEGCFSYLRVSITRLDICSFSLVSYCNRLLREQIYDGYDTEAPILLETCDLNTHEAITTSSNIAYIELSTDVIRQGSWFDLTWIQIARDTSDGGNVDITLSECNKEVALVGKNNITYEFTSPGYPDGYEANLHCAWIFTSPPGTHLVLRFLVMDLEEVSNCISDYVAVYSGNAITTPDNANLLQQLCLVNSTSTLVKADNVMTVKFVSDSYINKTGFSAYVYRDCGGKLQGPNGVIEISNVTIKTVVRSWQVNCEWTVEVRPGRTIEVNIVEMSIEQGPSWTCTANYLMLKNGGDVTSPLLGVGKYCGNVVPAPLQTIGNRLYVKALGIRSNINFKLTYREVNTNCGGEFVLSKKQKEWEIKTPNYPNIPAPYSECTWTAISPGKERIALHFVDRFDLSYTLDCEKEYVEVRDGGTENSKLIGRYCKDVAPSSITSTGNMLYVHFYTDLPEPKNGFKAVFSIKDVCGGTIRGTHGLISSPNYPFFYPKNQTCNWLIIAPVDHTLKFTFLDIHMPGFRRCNNFDHVEISEILPGNDTASPIGMYCGRTPPVVETASNQALVTFKSDNFEYTLFRGFTMTFDASQEVCGGEFTAMESVIKSNGYPNVATRSRYCDWRIKLPKGFQVVVEIEDLDVISSPESRFEYSLMFYNDFRFRSRIKVLQQQMTTQQIRSSSNTMMIGYYSSPGYRGFKLRYHAQAPAPCGGVITSVRGNISGPAVQPFNESSYFCQWDVNAPESIMNNINNTGLTLTLMVTGMIGGIRGHTFSKHCYSHQYISLTGVGMICGNFSEPVYLRSPKLVNELIIVNSSYGKLMDFKLQYQWQPCGGILEGLLNVISTPKNISYPINCVWHANYPDNGEMIKLHFNRLHLGSCDKNYISVRNGGPVSPEIGKFCGDVQPYNITSTSNKLWIEYTAAEEPNDFEFVLEPANNGCGGALHGNSREISSPKFPSQYPNNAECTWEITGDNGFHVGLVFVDRFNLETSNNCEKDYVQAFDWVTQTSESSRGIWRDLGKVCGRNTPLPFNSTGNRMKVIFHANEAVQGDGFRAVWSENCGGVFDVTSHINVIQSPSYPNLYQPNLFCNYTLVAPDKEIIIEFTDFHLEYSRRDCRFDNVTIIVEEKYSMEELVRCGEDKPPILRSLGKAVIVFRTDKYLQRNGFVFKYYINECGGNITTPGNIEPLMNGAEYFGGLNCVWRIQAPPDKNIVLRFERFELEYSHSCIYDYVNIYEGPEADNGHKLATLCGNLTQSLPIMKSVSNSLQVEFFTDGSRHYGGFLAKILFVKSAAAGCGGTINLSSTESYSFKTQQGSTYDSLEDCHWKVFTELGKNIKFTINSIDVRNATNRTTSGDKCTGDYLEIRDGAGPFSEPIGIYCGKQAPLPIVSSTNALWIRFFSDGTLEGAGVSGTLEAINASCAFAPTLDNTVHVLTSPNYPNNYEPGSRCRWLLQWEHSTTERIKIEFLDFDVAESGTCENDYLQITDTMNRKFISEGFGKDFIFNGHHNEYINHEQSSHTPSTTYKYCGSELPHDYYSYSTEIEIVFNGASSGHRGFKLEYSNASCNRNYTAEQGRIIHEKIDQCWITITAPVNHTISLYFNQFVLYDPQGCTLSALQASIFNFITEKSPIEIPFTLNIISLKVFDGGFNDTLLAKLCEMEVPNPIFSTGNKLSLHSWSEWRTTYEYYDITYTTTDKGRGCGGRLYNYAGSFTSPLYPNEYRNNTVCTWDVSVPRGLKLVLEFTMFDIGTKNTCNLNYNTVKLYDVTSTGALTLVTTYCGGDDPAPFEASSNRVVVEYVSSMNNVGTGWSAIFKSRSN
ncbi:Cubn [Anthophora quadrimaculata]